jgi:TolB-like protein/DNA-binding winged helix-turn-helix (wHTH) protein
MRYKFGSFTLNTETCELTSGTDLLETEPQVFRVLQYLVENRTRVISKEEIVNSIWNGRAISDSALTYAIREARLLVGDNGKAQDVIRTLPRRGFRFIAQVTELPGTENTNASEQNETHLLTRIPTASRRWRMVGIAAAVVVFFVAAGLSWQRPWIDKVEAANPEDLAFPLPDVPSVAVLPFQNLSGDASRDFMSDGIAENITTVLSRVPDIVAAPWVSVRSYKGEQVTVRQVAEELAVGYVLAGSVRHFGDQVRVTVQLTDALKGRHIWTQTYDEIVEDAFAIQDSIALSVLTELEVTLTKGLGARAMLGGGTKNLEAYRLYQRALALWWEIKKRNSSEIQNLLIQAVALDPSYAYAWNLLGWTHLLAANRGWTSDPELEKQKALEFAEKAIELDPSNEGPYLLLANHALREGRHSEAVELARKGSENAPHNHLAVAVLANALIFSGQPENALAPIQRLKRFPPLPPLRILRQEGLAHYAKDVFTLAALALIYADSGRAQEAHEAALRVVDVFPRFSAKRFVASALPYQDQAKSKRALATFLQLGLPE